MIKQILTIVAVTILILIVPGPDMIVGGKKAGNLTAARILACNLVRISCCIVTSNILKYAGATYLIFLGISSLRTFAQSPYRSKLELTRIKSRLELISYRASSTMS